MTFLMVMPRTGCRQSLVSSYLNCTILFVSSHSLRTAITSQGGSISVPSGSNALAAIDTGTTLIGGPSDAIAAIYANIPNSQAGTGNLEGYYIYRERTGPLIFFLPINCLHI